MEAKRRVQRIAGARIIMNYEIFIQSSDDFERVFAEIGFGNGAAIVLSQEGKIDEYQVSIYPPKGYDRCDFVDSRRNARCEIPLITLIESLERAKASLKGS